MLCTLAYTFALRRPKRAPPPTCHPSGYYRDGHPSPFARRYPETHLYSLILHLIICLNSAGISTPSRAPPAPHRHRRNASQTIHHPCSLARLVSDSSWLGRPPSRAGVPGAQPPALGDARNRAAEGATPLSDLLYQGHVALTGAHRGAHRPHR